MHARGFYETLSSASGNTANPERFQEQRQTATAGWSRLDESPLEFSMPEATPQEVSAAPKKRRGRPPKVIRRDPDDAPADGDYGDDVVVDKEPGFRYMWAHDDDISRFMGRGAVACDRANEQARPVFDRRAKSGEGDIVIKNLTLMKISEEDAQRAERPGIQRANRRMKTVRADAIKQLGDGTMANISELEYRANGS